MSNWLVRVQTRTYNIRVLNGGCESKQSPRPVVLLILRFLTLCRFTSFFLAFRLFTSFFLAFRLFAARASGRIVLMACPFQLVRPSRTHSGTRRFAQHRGVYVHLVWSSKRMTFQSADMEGTVAEWHITADKISTFREHDNER